MDLHCWYDVYESPLVSEILSNKIHWYFTSHKKNNEDLYENKVEKQTESKLLNVM